MFFYRDLVDGHIKYLRLSPGEVNTDKQKEVKLLHEAIIALWKNISGKVWHQQEVNQSRITETGLDHSDT